MSFVGREDLQTVFGAYPWGICPFSAVQPHLLPVRSRQMLPEDAKSIFVVLFPYLLHADAYTDQRLSRYAVPADYHVLCGERLDVMCARLQTMFPANRFVRFVDASPVPEVFAAACAGLGAIGKNGLLLTEDYGSWVFIGTVVTDLCVPCEAATPAACNGCNACIAACPTGALQEKGLCREKCLSHISQKRKLTDSDISLLRAHTVLWGCDRCQTACPQNRRAKITFDETMHSTASCRLDANDPLRAYAWRGDAVFRNRTLLETESE